MDAFIDEHLFFLPIPRFCASRAKQFIFKKSNEETIDTICQGHKFAMQFFSDKDSLKDSVDVQQIYEQYLTYFPHIKCLRDTKIDLDTLGHLLCLMALDPVQLQKMPLTIHQADSFLNDVKIVVAQETKNKEADNTLDLFEQVHNYLNDCDNTWQSVEDLKEFMSNSLYESLQMYKGANVKNVLEECPQCSLTLGSYVRRICI